MKRVMLGVLLGGLMISSLSLGTPAQAHDHDDWCRWRAHRNWAASRWNPYVNNMYYANPYYAPAANLSLWQRIRYGLF